MTFHKSLFRFWRLLYFDQTFSVDSQIISCGSLKTSKASELKWREKILSLGNFIFPHVSRHSFPVFHWWFKFNSNLMSWWSEPGAFFVQCLLHPRSKDTSKMTPPCQSRSGQLGSPNTPVVLVSVALDRLFGASLGFTFLIQIKSIYLFIG